jgi:filamentous hemagglutinin family protein
MARKRNGMHVGPISRDRFGLARVPRSALLRSSALCGVAAICAVVPVDYVWAQATNAHPTNPTTQLGSGSYGYNGTTTTINQTSNVLATGWSSFDVGAAQKVQINQPSATAVSVNRVAAGDPSRIAGSINANGVFVLVNPSGVVFSQGAQVNAASVIVSTADVANKNLQAGKLIFDQPGRPGAMVVNNGNITVKQTGLAALVAPGVANAGTISAPMGRVALAGGEASVVDLYGDGLMSIDVTKQVTTVPTGPDGKPVTALVTNSGVIAARGGRIDLTAKAVDGIVTTLVDAGGKISANTSKSGQTGTVVVSGLGGSLSIEGQISAAGNAPGTKGGAVEVNASNAVNVASTAKINVSGKAGGGVAAIGTTLKRATGGPAVTEQPTAKSVSIASGATIDASARNKGKGGTVTVLSTDDTDMSGLILAKGGPLGGDGGFVEVSGHGGYSLTGSIDVTAAMGNAGGILLDPTNITVIGSTGNADSTIDAHGSLGANDSATNATVSNTELGNLGGNVTLLADNGITFSAAVDFTKSTNLFVTAGAGGVTFGSGADITVTGTGNKSLTLVVSSGGTIGVGNSIDTSNGGNAPGGITLSAAGNISLGTAGSTTAITTGVLDVSTSSGGNVSQATGNSINVGTLQSATGVAGSLSLTNSGNSVGVLNAVAVTGNAGLVSTGSMTVTGVTSVGSGNTLFVSVPTITLGTSGGGGVSGGLQANGGTLSVFTNRITATSNGGALTATGGVVEIAPQASESIAFGSGVNFHTGTLEIDPSAVSVTAGTLRLGQAAGTTVATSITVAAATALTTVGTVDFETSGAVTQTGSLSGAAIAGSASSVVLTSTHNVITAVGNLTGTNGVTLVNNGALPIDGIVSANSGNVVLTATGGNALTLSGSIGALGATLNADSVTGTGSLSVGTLTGSAAAAFSLTGSNAIGTLGAISGVGVTIDNNASLTIAGLVNANAGSAVINNGSLGLTLANGGTIGITGANAIDINAGSIVLNGVLTASNAGATVGLTAATGGITQAATGVVTAGNITGSASTTAQFAGTANAIAALGSFSAPGGFTLVDSANLTQTGVVNAGSGAAVVNVGTNLLSLNGTILGASASLTTGTLVFGASSSLGVTGLAQLIASKANIDQTLGFISAGTLAGSAFSTGVFTNGAAIANLGSFITGGGFTLAANAGSLTIGGLIAGGTGGVVIDNGTTGLAIGSGGSISAQSVALTGGSLDLGGGITDPGTLLLIANTGTIGQTAAFNVGTLTGSAAADARFGSTNTVATLGSFVSGGTFVLNDGTALTVNNLVTASVIGIAASSLAMDDGGTHPGTLVAGGGLISIRTGSLTAGIAGDVIDAGATGTIEFAPKTSGDLIVLGGGGTGTLAIDPSSADLTLTDGTLRLGAVNGTIVAGSIAIAAGNAALSVGTLDLEATHGVTQGVAFTATEITGNVGSIVLTNSGNAISAIGGLTASGGVTIANTGSVTLSGPLIANSGTVVLTGNTVINLTGSMTAAAATLSAGTLVIPGTLSATGLALLTATSAGGVSETGALNLGTLAVGSAGNASFSGANGIGTLGAVSAAAFVLNNGSADIAVAGTALAGTSFTLTTTGSISVPGTIGSTPAATAITVGLTAGPAIAIGGLLTDGGTGTTTLVTNGGTVSGTGTVAIGTLTGSSAVLSLTGAHISVGTLSAYSASNALTLIDSAALTAIGLNGGGSVVAIETPALTFGDGTNSGTLLASGGTVSIKADAIALGAANEGTIDAGAGGVFELTGSGASVIALGTVSSTGTLGVNLGSLAIAAGTLRLGSFEGATSATAIAIAGSGDLHSLFGTLDLRASGAVTQTDSLIVGTLMGSAGTVVLADAHNSISTLGSFASTSDFTLASAASLSVGGLLSSGGSVVLDTGTAGLGIATGGRVTGTAISLSGGSIDIAGSVDTPNLLTLLSNQGSIAQVGTGFLRGATLTGLAATYASLLGSNAVGTLAAFSAVNGFTLTNNADLAQTGLLDAHSGTVSIGTGSHTLSIGGTVTAIAAAFTGAAVIEASGAFLNAASLSGSIAGLANLQGTNAVSELDTFSAGTLLLNAGTIGLDVAGVVTVGKTVVLTDTGTIQIPGTIIAASGSQIAIGLHGSSIDIAGLVNDGGAGTTGLFTAGTISESGSLIAGTLSGSADVANLASAHNTIAALGSFTANTLVLADTASLAVSGIVTVGTTISITDASTIDVSGKIIPVSGSVIGVGLTAGTGASDLLLISGLVSDGGSGTISLVANTGTVSELAAGTIVAGSLSGTASVMSLLGSANTIASIAGLAGGSTLAVVDSGALTVGNNINSGLIDLSAGTLTVSSSLTATNITLAATAGTLTVTGTVDASGSTALSGLQGVEANGGVILGDGAVVANSGSGFVDLTNTGNVIASIGGTAHTGFAANSGSALSIGNLAAGTSITIGTTGSLVVSGTVGPIVGVGSIAVGLTGAAIDVLGLLSDGGAGSINLDATVGGITGAGTVISGIISATGTLFNLTGTNTIAAFGAITGAGSVIVNSSHSLDITNPLTATTLIAISAPTLTVDTSLTAPSATITASSGLLSLTGTINVTNGVTLSGATGISGANETIIGGGSLIANAAAGNIVLTNSNNAVSSVTGTATLGDFRFNNSTILSIGNLTAGGTAAIGATALGLAGTLTAAHAQLVASTGSLDIASGAQLNPSHDATLTALSGLLSVEGTIAPPSGSNVALALSAGTIHISGLVSDGGNGQTSLDVNAGTITETGTLLVGTLTGTAGLASLTDPGFSNMVGTLGNFNAGTLILNDGTALTINGSVSIGTLIAIDDSSSITVAGTGTILAQAGSVISVGLTATGLALSGLVSDSGSGQTDLAINGGTIAGASGTLVAGTLTGTADTILLTNNANAVGTLNAFTATTSFALVDSVGLTALRGSGGGANVDITAPSIQLGDSATMGTLLATPGGRLSITTGTLTVGSAGSSLGVLSTDGGTLEIAPSATTDVLALGGASSAGTLGVDFSRLSLDSDLLVLGGHHGTVASGGITVASNTSLSVATVELLTSGTVSQGGGTLGAGTLIGTAGVVALGDTLNAIATLGAFHTTGDFDLGDGTTLVVAGPLTAGGTVVLSPSTHLLAITGGISAAAASLTAAAILLTGSLGVTNGATLVANGGDINEAAGSIVAASLTGSAAGNANFGGTNQIGTLAGFATGSGFSIADGQSLSIANTLTNASGSVVVDTGTFGLGVPGTIVSPSASLTAGSIDVPGSLDIGGLLTLMTNQGSIGAGGNVTAGTLTGSAVSTASFTGSNAIGTLAAFTAANGFTLADTQGLTVSGSVIASSGSAVIDDGSAGLTIASTVSALAVSLTAGDISLNGSVGAAGLATLIANQGTIGEGGSGILSAATLTGSAASTATLTGANQVGTLANFAAPLGFSLTDGRGLSVTGSVASSGGTVTLNDGSFALGIGGTVSAAAVALTAGSIDIPGHVTGNGLVTLTANQTQITEAGFLNAGTLTGSAATTASFTGANAVATLAAFTAPGGFTLDNGIALTQVGLLSSPGNAVILDQGSNDATLRGTIGAGSLTLTAGNVTASGTLSLTGTASLSASGTISDTGPILAGTLTGRASQASFSGSNSLTAVGNFTATGGFTLDAVSNLIVAGAIASAGGTVAISNDLHADIVTGSITGAAVALTAATLLIDGSVGSPGLVTLNTDSGGSVTEATTGVLNAGTLSGSNSGVVSLTGTNSIASIGSLSATNGFTLTNGSSLQVTTLLASSGTIAIDNSGNPITVAGLIQGGGSTPISLIGNGITVTGGIGQGALTLTSTGNIFETGSLNVASLQGGATTDAVLTGSNTIATVNAFAVGTGFTLDNTASLSVAGLISTSSGTVLIDNGTQALNIGGGISGAAVSLSAGTIGLTGTGSLTATGVASLVANAGGVNEASTAFLNAGTLVGLLTGAATLTGNNLVGTLGNFTAPSGLNLADGQSLSVAGLVSAASGTVIVDTNGFGLGVPGSISAVAATLTAGSIDIPGSLGVSGTADLVATAGSISENGSLTAGLLTGSAVSTATFSGSNLIAALGTFSAPGGLTVTDGEFLTVSGLANASGGTVAIDTGTFGISVTGGISGQAATISAGSIDVSGSLIATNTLDLIAGVGSIAVPGNVTLAAGTLTGSAVTTASFTGTNTIATLGAFAAPSGFTLSDAAALSVAGLVTSSGTIGIDTGGFHLDVPGTISGQSVTLAAGTIDIGGSLAATTLADLVASGGSIAVPGNISLNAGTLTGSAATTASFTGSNAIATLAGFSAPSGFTLDDGQALSVTGNVAASGGTIQIGTGSAGLNVSGGLNAISATLAAGAITIGGSLVVGGTADLAASTGTIAVTGSLAAGTLTGSAHTSANFGGTELVTNLGNFTSPSGFTLVNGQALNVTGSVAASGGTVALNTGGALLSVASTGAVTGQAATLTAGTLAIAGSLGVGGLADLLVNGGTITDTGTIAAGTLAGTATLASLTGASATANQIGTLGNFGAGVLTLNDGLGLTIAGSVSVGSSIAVTDSGLLSVTGTVAPSGGNIAVALTAGTLAISGLVSDGGAGTTSLLVSGGTISENTGTLVAGTLSGAAGTAILSGPSNAIATLGSFAAAATLVLVDSIALTQSGTQTAANLISLTASTLTTTGLISAPNTTLVATAGTLGLTGTVNATTAAVLTAQQDVAGASGLVTGGGILTATSSLGAVTLTNASNAVTGINGSAATRFSVSDSDTAIVQHIAAGSTVAIVDSGALTVSGTIAPTAGTTAIAVGLTAASISIPGLLSDGGAGSTTLIANSGSVSETGSIIAGTLSASGTSLTFSNSNTIAALGNISGGAQFVFGDTEALGIAGLVTASTLIAVTAPALTVSGTVAAPTTELIATVGTLGFTGTVQAATAIVMDGAGGILGAGGLITGGAALNANSNAGSVILTNPSNSVASVTGNAAGNYLFVNSGSVSLGNLSAGTIASVGATAITVGGSVVAPNVTLAASTGNIAVNGSIVPSVSGAFTATGGTIDVASTAEIAPPNGVTAIALGLNAQQIVIVGKVSDGGAGTTSLTVPVSGGVIEETGTLIAGTVSGSAQRADLTGTLASNSIATLGAFNAGTMNINDSVALTVSGLVTIGTALEINDTAPLTVAGTIAPPAGTNIALGLTASAISIPGVVSDGGAGGAFLTATGGSITETGALILGSVQGHATGDIALSGANQIGIIAAMTAGGNLLVHDNTSLQLTGGFQSGTAGGASSSMEVDVLGNGANLTIGSGAFVTAGVQGSTTGNITFRAGSDSLAGSVVINGGVYAENGGAITVTAGYNVNNNAWNVIGSGSTISLTGTLWGDASKASLNSVVNLGAAGSIDESVGTAAIGTAILTGRAGGFANFGETSGGALASGPAGNRIATLASFVSNANGGDSAQGFLLRDGQSLTVTGPVIDEGATNSRGVAISVVPPGYSAGNLTIGGEIFANTTVNTQATGGIAETTGGSIVARTLTTQAGVIPSTETSGNVAGTYPATITANAASAFYGTASSGNINQIGTLANVTATGTLSLYDALSLTVAGNVVSGITPAGVGTNGSIAIGTGMTLASASALSIGGTLDVASQGGVMSLSAPNVTLGNGFGAATLKASTLQLFATNGVTVNNNTVIDTGGDVFKRPASSTGVPVNPGPATAGAHFFLGSGGLTQTGAMTVGSYVAANPAGAVGTAHPELDIRLTAGSGAIAFDFGSGLSAPTTSLLLTLGDAGSAAGKVVADSISVFYTGTTGGTTNLLATLYTSTGVQVVGQAAATQSYIAKNDAFIPSGHFQVNACAISSVNCVLISPFTSVPIVNPLANLPTEFLTDESDDPDLLIPNVTDQED